MSGLEGKSGENNDISNGEKPGEDAALTAESTALQEEKGELAERRAGDEAAGAANAQVVVMEGEAHKPSQQTIDTAEALKTEGNVLLQSEFCLLMSFACGCGQSWFL